jgi:hypothetical protein
MSGPRRDPLDGMTRRGFLWIWLLAAVVGGPALAVVYAVCQWLPLGFSPSWTDGLVEGVLVPPVSLAMLAIRRRWIRRRLSASQPSDPKPGPAMEGRG